MLWQDNSTSHENCEYIFHTIRLKPRKITFKVKHVGVDKNSVSFAQYTHIYTTSETMTIQPDMHANKTTVHDTMRQIRATQSMATNKHR